MQTNKLTAEIPEGIDRAIKRYYSHHPVDIDEARQIIKEAIRSGTVAADVHPTDLVNLVLFGDREEAYLTVRKLALEVLRNPERIGTTSNGERLACALMFARADWLEGYSWAAAARRVGDAWLKAIVNVEDDFRWLRPAIYLPSAGAALAPGARAGLGNSRKIS